MTPVRTTSGAIDLSLADLRVVAAFALDSATPLLPVFQSTSPGVLDVALRDEGDRLPSPSDA